MAEKSLLRTGWFLAIMCFFFGVLGVHRFIVGKIGTGILWLVTGGIFSIGALVLSSFFDKIFCQKYGF